MKSKVLITSSWEITLSGLVRWRRALTDWAEWRNDGRQQASSLLILHSDLTITTNNTNTKHQTLLYLLPYQQPLLPILNTNTNTYYTYYQYQQPLLPILNTNTKTYYQYQHLLFLIPIPTLTKLTTNTNIQHLLYLPTTFTCNTYYQYQLLFLLPTLTFHCPLQETYPLLCSSLVCWFQSLLLGSPIIRLTSCWQWHNPRVSPDNNILFILILEIAYSVNSQ